MNKPDKIWAWPEDVENGYMAASHVGEPPTPEFSGSHTTYLLSTPERELASELVETLWEIASAYDEMIWGEDYEYVEAANVMHDKARAVLAKLDKGE